MLAPCALAEIYPVDSAGIKANLERRGSHTMMLGCSVGDGYTFTLDENASTGYKWQLDETSDVVRVEIKALPAPKSHRPRVGGPGKVQVTITALKPGEANFSLSYTRYWERDQKPTRIILLSVMVDGDE